MKKYREGDFGVCPRALCDGQPVVPVRPFSRANMNRSLPD